MYFLYINMSYYADLCILPTASMSEIEIAYNKLTNEKTTSIDNKIKYVKAYSTLSDYNSRRKYDNLMEETNDNITGMDNNEFNSEFNNNIEIHKNDSYLNNDNSLNNEIIHIINKAFIELNVRLENIEKRIYQNNSVNNNFYKEKQRIKTTFENGKKITNIITDLNINGKKKQKIKTIGYDNDGNQEITYKVKNI